MTLSAEPATAPSALHHARARHSRLARLWRALAGRAFRGGLSRAVSLLVVVSFVLQPSALAAGNRAPAVLAAQSQAPAWSGPGTAPGPGSPSGRAFSIDGTPFADQGESGRALQTPRPPDGISVYEDSGVNCSSPPPSQAPLPFEEKSWPRVIKTLYLCSTGATAHVRIFAEARGWALNLLLGVTCLEGGAGFNPPAAQQYDLYLSGLCLHRRMVIEGDVYFPPGKYRLYSDALFGWCYGWCEGNCFNRVVIDVSPPYNSGATCPDGTCWGANSSGWAGPGAAINTRSGNFSHQELDFSIPTRGLPLTFERSYNSLDPTVGPLGRGWTHNYNMHLVTGVYTTTVVAPRGSQLSFDKNSDGSYTPWAGVRAKLARNEDGTYTVTTGDQAAYTFDANGRLTSEADSRGNVSSLTYTDGLLTAVTAPDGRSLTLDYDGNGNLTQVTDPLGRTERYTYTTTGSGVPYLTAAVDPENQARAYEYDTVGTGGMTALVDENGERLTNHYDGLSRVDVQTGPTGEVTRPSYYSADAYQPVTRTVVTTGGQPVTHTYSLEGTLVAVTDGLGHARRYEYDNHRNVVGVTDALSRTTHYTWNDCNCNVSRTEDALGYVTTREYDERNNLLSETDPLTRTTRYAYDAHDNLVAITNTLGYTATFAYDASGQLLESRDADGHPTRYGYDGYGNVAVITDTLGRPTRMAYDLGGQVTSVTDAKGGTTHYAYDGAGRVVTTTDALQGRTVNQYDAAGNLTRVTDAAGRTTVLGYDAAGRLITTTNALGDSTVRSYDALGRLTRVTDANGNATRYGYDVAGRLITVTDALNQATVYGYDAAGNQTRVTDARGKTAYMGYDALGRTVAITDTLGHVTRYGYDPVGNRTWELDPTGVLVHYTYDELHRLKTVAGPLGTVLTSGYDRAGNLTSVTDADGHPMRYTFDALDRLHSVLDALGGETVYDYDPLGNLMTVTDARQHATQGVYDALNRLTRVSDPLGHATAYGYDAVGNTTVITDADLGVTRLSYDSLYRVTDVSYPDSTVSYGYDRVGNRLAMTDTTGVTTYAFDEVYRPLTITAPFAGAVSYLYDAVGNRVHTGYPNGAGAGYGYDDAGRLAWVADSQGGLTGYTYDDAGRLEQADLPNGVQSVYGYDAAGRLTSIEHHKAGDWQTRYDYGLDAAGNRVAITETTTALKTSYAAGLGRPAAGPGLAGAWPEGSLTGQVIRYSYDAYDRLTAAAYSNGDRYEYGYDAAGNRTALTLTLGGVQSRTTAYAYDDADRLTSVDGQPYSYDNRGNLSGDGTWTYSYDGAGRMVGAASVSATQVYTYNGDGLRVARSVQGQQLAFTWDQAGGLPQVLASSDGARFLYGLERLGLIQGGEWAYELHDALGSVRQWTDTSGAVVGMQAYGPFGEPLTPLGPPLAAWGYTGEWQDPTGLVYLRARWYNAASGRFTQLDPLPGTVGAPATQRRYAYAFSNPLRYTDPTGLLTHKELEDLLGSQWSVFDNLWEAKDPYWSAVVTELGANDDLYVSDLPGWMFRFTVRNGHMEMDAYLGQNNVGTMRFEELQGKGAYAIKHPNQPDSEVAAQRDSMFSEYGYDPILYEPVYNYSYQGGKLCPEYVGAQRVLRVGVDPEYTSIIGAGLRRVLRRNSSWTELPGTFLEGVAVALFVLAMGLGGWQVALLSSAAAPIADAAYSLLFNPGRYEYLTGWDQLTPHVNAQIDEDFFPSTRPKRSP